VKAITARIRRLAAEMADAMAAVHGAGIAAIQVGEPVRMFLIDGTVATGVHGATPVVFVNPVLVQADGDPETAEEGCLSLPEMAIPVSRVPHVVMTATDIEGKSFTVDATGWFARALQHELDHLEGVVILDRKAQ
jgi:peptide deformylase